MLNYNLNVKIILGAHANDFIAQQIQEAEAKAPEDLTEEDKMVLLGRPKNGDIVRAQLRIKESKEFKVSFSFIFSPLLTSNFDIGQYLPLISN
jgi:hypothetical protein